jgi:hypothetical protein
MITGRRIHAQTRVFDFHGDHVGPRRLKRGLSIHLGSAAAQVQISISWRVPRCWPVERISASRAVRREPVAAACTTWRRSGCEYGAAGSARCASAGCSAPAFGAR